MTIREYKPYDLKQMINIWNKIIEDANAFPEEELLNIKTGKLFFASQSFCAVATDENNIIEGLYILHPNNTGRSGHICNASYAVDPTRRGKHIGEKLVLHSMKKAKESGFLIMQFDAVVQSNTRARRLYEKLGFHSLGIIPNGYRMKDGHYENICPYYIEL